ncbi:MAG: carbon-nitrogen hydrolase family protein [Firmicutes bacterium]|nr:carbon-nitrogen hydrolase family protein [Bacillota bacterium]
MIACVQMKLAAEDYRTEKTFETKIMGLMEQIRRRSGKGQLLVVFPEHIGTFCLLCNEPDRVWSSKSFAQAISRLVQANSVRIGYQKLLQRVSWVRALILVKSLEAERIYLSTFQKAAREYGAWIVAGSAALRWGETNKVYNTSPVVTPSGDIIYRQHKIYLVEMEEKNGLDLNAAPLNYTSAVRSPFGRLGIAICLDAFQEKIWERHQGLGSEILIQPSANNGPWDDWQRKDWLNSTYTAVYKKKIFSLGINPMLVGNLWDLKFEGQSGIVDQTGFAAQAKTHNEEEILLRKDLLNSV